MGKRKKAYAASAAAVVITAWLLWGNLTVGTTYYHASFAELPASFDGFKIAQLSDFHNARFGRDNAMIVDILKREKPDMIAITGDYIDSRRTDIGIAEKLTEQITRIAPCYYITGNHEARLGEEYAELEKSMIDAGVIVLRDETCLFLRGDEAIRIAGLDDPKFKGGSCEIRDSLKPPEDERRFTLLLSHRPEAFEEYVRGGFDLALCGHAHGGQVRIPFLGGLAAPNQGLLPRYDAGVFRKGETTMIVSRGLGNSIIPIRVNNRPEVIIIELQREDRENNNKHATESENPV